MKNRYRIVGPNGRWPLADVPRSSRGFSLIELVVVIGIIGLLAAIAIPNYNNYVVKGKLTEAFTQLTELQNRQEQYYQDNRAYKNNMTTAAGQYFSSSCTTTTGQEFTCTATPGASTGIGFKYTVTEAGTKATVATSPAIAGWTVPGTGCWAKDKSGAC